MIAGTQLRLHTEYYVHVIELIAFERAARYFGANAFVVTGGIRKVDKIVFGELRMQHHIHQSALAHGGHGRHAADGLRIEFEIAADHAQPPGAFGHQHAAVGQEGERPGVRQAFRKRGDPNAMFLRSVGLRERDTS